MNSPFDPRIGRLISDPPGRGPGYWAGAPGAFSDGNDLYLVYRLRWPRPRRGAELRLARGDGERFATIWRATREDFGSESIERCAIVRDGPHWRLYVSYVNAMDGRWQIDLLEAAAPDGFDPRVRIRVLDADMASAIAVKDPWLRREGDRWLMFVSFGDRLVGGGRLHASGDALSTGAVKSETGLATSADGVHWRWEGKILAVSTAGWDRFTARLTTAVRSDDVWLGIYDGSADVSENYEERCGLARSDDLRRWTRLNDGPVVGAAGGPGTVRYVESVVHRDRTLFFFELTRDDGAHELRVSQAARDTPG